VKEIFDALLARLRGIRQQPQLAETAQTHSTARKNMPEIPSEALLKAAISARLQRVMQENAALADQEERSHQSQAVRRAAEIIASIPRLLEEECRSTGRREARRGNALTSWSDSVRVMDLEEYETTEFCWTESPSPYALRYAAKLVYNCCMEAELNPRLYHSDGRISGKGHHIYMTVSGAAGSHVELSEESNRQF
jgi:uncharacterized protein YbaR (Trm112 family)